jgi:hypothetical protein
MSSIAKNPFKIGDKVRRRVGTLGGTGQIGTVIAILMRGVHECLTVKFADRTETFVWHVYEVPK